MFCMPYPFAKIDKQTRIMNRVLICIISLSMAIPCIGQWKAAGDKIKTEWGAKIDPANVHQEYPRPLMERNDWMNLNGLWNYAIVPASLARDDNSIPISASSAKAEKFDGKILVPFCVESALSGVGKTVGANKVLWYQRSFQVPETWQGKKILLHFGASDWQTDLWVNGIKVGSHTGGYTPFNFDITAALKKGENVVDVRVWDPTDESHQPRGKQVKDPRGIWYTPVTGIWQTVWLEPVPETYISKIKTTPNLDENSFKIEVITNCPRGFDSAELALFDGGKQVASAKSLAGQPIEVRIDNPKLWSPDSPFLYDMQVRIFKGGKEIDSVKSYAAMRKFSIVKDSKGIKRLALNGKPIYQLGPLDQGWWPDGLYTAPSDEALRFDVQKIKDLGFNMIRKHIKVEPARWYMHCDRLGIIVWQDMPSGDFETVVNGRRSLPLPEWNRNSLFKKAEYVRSAESEACFRKEWKDIMDFLYSHPCIGMWIPFNERWGQFKTDEITEWTMKYDSTRPVNAASGGNYYTCSHILDIHSYPHPQILIYDCDKVNVIGEFGGVGLAVKGNLWKEKGNWSYTTKQSADASNDKSPSEAERALAMYKEYADMLSEMTQRGISAGVYTQITDVEGEINGLLTYDRKVVKFDESEIRKANKKVIDSLNK